MSTVTSPLKDRLLQALTDYHGDPKQPDVAQAIDELVAAQSLTLDPNDPRPLIGDWRLISAPNFPNGQLREDGRYAYTPGRLAFNQFQPTGLTVVIDEVQQPVFPLNDASVAPYDHSHNICVNFTVTENAYAGLRGTVTNLGICQLLPEQQLGVKFTGGELKPHPEADHEQWQRCFNTDNPSMLSWRERLQTAGATHLICKNQARQSFQRLS